MSFCSNCGTKIAEGGKFCPNCGTAAPVETTAPVVPAAPVAPAAPKPKGSFYVSGSLSGKSGDAAKPTFTTKMGGAAAPVAPAPQVTTPPPVAKPVTPPPAPEPFAPVAKPVTPPPVAKPVTPPPAPEPFAPIGVKPHDVPPAEIFAPSKPPAPRTGGAGRRISPGKELKLLLRQGILVLVGDKRNLIISLLFPVMAALVTVLIAGEDMFNTHEATKSACFVLVCAAIWGGLFNSIQSLVKERKNIKRDYVSGALRIECYMGSRAIIQVVLCAVQSLVLTMAIPAVNWVHGNSLPSSGLFGIPAIIEFYLTLFLIMYASDALGLLISSFVKKEELASKLAPYILIAQLLFSGVLFELGDAANVFSMIMISRWGMEAMGSICDLNDTVSRTYTSLTSKGMKPGMCPCGILEELRLVPAAEGDPFEATAGHLAFVFFIMILFVVVPLIAANYLLHQVKKDGRD